MRRFRWFLSVMAVLAGASAIGAATVAAKMLLLDAALAGNVIVAVGEGGTILRSADSCQSWQSADSAVLATLTGVSFAADARHGWAVGHDALILATDDGGRSWRKSWQGENLEVSLLDVCALDARHVIAVGAYGLFIESTDGGATWSPRKILADDMHLNRISRGPAGTLYLAGERGTLLSSADDGSTWTRLQTPYEGSFYGILPLDAHTLLAHGLRGRLYRSADDGATWDLVAVPQPMLLATALKLPGGSLVFAGQSRGLFVSRDAGQTVVPWDAPLTTAVAELILAPDGTIVALGEAGATLLAQP
jgi:photosystem II stability/assembly factor-like uncharacterized protein